jgi:hypothetical protein
MVKLGDIVRWKVSTSSYLVVFDAATGEFKLLSLDADDGRALTVYADSSLHALENGSATIIGNYFYIPDK